MNTHNPLICALDTTDVSLAHGLCESLTGKVGAVKLGLEFFTAHGPQGVRDVMGKCNLPFFLDLKFHDIPNTVAGAVRSALKLSPLLLTVHAAGGAEMLKAAAHAAAETEKNRPKLLGITVLTSLDQADLQHTGIAGGVEDQVRRMASLAQESGLDGVVCSPHEIGMLRKDCGKDFLLVVPGIRPEGSQNGDQKRVLTPRAAIAEGADYLVIGRPITGAPDAPAAVTSILNSLEPHHA